MSGQPPTENERPRQRPRGQQQIVLISIALAIYLLTLWFGISVIGDSTGRSSLMAGLIAVMGTMAYLAARRPAPPG